MTDLELVPARHQTRKHPDLAPNVMFNFAGLEEKQGNLDKARRWYQQAISIKNPETAPMAMLGRSDPEFYRATRARRAAGISKPSRADTARRY